MGWSCAMRPPKKKKKKKRKAHIVPSTIAAESFLLGSIASHPTPTQSQNVCRLLFPVF